MTDHHRVPPLVPILGGLVIVAIAALYYSRYIDVGFNVADDGHFAQVAYELWRGTDPHTIRFGYGLAWFKLGEMLFSLSGPSYHLVQALFFSVLAVTAGLVFAAVERLTANLPLAAIAGLAVAVVPAFPPTAFYAFCTLINLLPLIVMAQRWRNLTVAPVAAAAVMLAITFQIRPDFGYAFSIPFGILLVAAGMIHGWRHFAALAGYAAAAFVAAHLPLIVDGLRHGYLDLVMADYRRYPGILLRLVRAGLERENLGAQAAAASAAGTLLPRPPLSALWQGPRAIADQAFVVYAPLAGLVTFVLFQLGKIVTVVRRGETASAVDRLLLAGVVIAAPLVSFPHYFLFRPDLAHVANFMPGYIVLVALLVWELAGGELVHDGRRRFGEWSGHGTAGRSLGGLAVGAGLAVLIAGYLNIGLTTLGTGSIAVLEGRDIPFTAANGVDVRVNDGERTVFTTIYRRIEESTAADQPIVCVPFCPGVAFMAARPMLLGDFYVDDSLLNSDPGWIERAIERTRAAATPIVIVFDWALNGTDISRFAVWAKPYIDFLDAAGYQRTDLPGIAIYRREP